MPGGGATRDADDDLGRRLPAAAALSPKSVGSALAGSGRRRRARRRRSEGGRPGHVAARVVVLGSHREQSADDGVRRDDRPAGSRRHSRRPRRADGHRHALATVHAALVPGPTSEAGARGVHGDLCLFLRVARRESKRGRCRTSGSPWPASLSAPTWCCCCCTWTASCTRCDRWRLRPRWPGRVSRSWRRSTGARPPCPAGITAAGRSRADASRSTRRDPARSRR